MIDKSVYMEIGPRAKPKTRNSGERYAPSTDPAQGEPILERIDGLLMKRWVEAKPEMKCQVEIHNYNGDWVAFGPTLLIAGMRCHVLSKLGEEVDVPEELCR